jgi:uncharacterized protein YraI
MKYIGIPKKVRKRDGMVRSALGVGLLLALVLVCVLGAESVFVSPSSSGTDVSVPPANAGLDGLTPLDPDSTMSSLDGRSDDIEATIPTDVVVTVTPTSVPSVSPTASPTPAYTETEESVHYYVTAELSIRTGPGTECEKVGLYVFGDEVDSVATTSNGWRKLSDGKYVFAEYLSLTPPEKPLTGTYYAQNNVNVRTGPGTDYEVTKKLSAGDAASVVAVTSNGWYRTSVGSYVFADNFAKTAPPTPTPKPTPTPTPKPQNLQCGLTEDEFEFFAAIVYLECPNDYEGQTWVAEVIWNRSRDTGGFGGSITHVLTAPYQFSTEKDGKPIKGATSTSSSRKAVVEAYNNEIFPRYVLFFRADYYFASPQIAYGEAGGNYFSYRQSDYDKYN